MERQLRMGGGIMNIVPREEAFLGGLKKAIKGVAKGIGSFIKSDAGKLALTAGALYGLGGGTFFGKSLPGIAGTGFKAGNILSNVKNLPFMSKAAGIFGLGKVLGGGMPQPQVGSFGGNPSAIRSYLREYFTNLNPQRDNEEDEEYEARINQLVESNMVEYMSEGSRTGFFLGGNFQQSEKQAQRDRDISRREAARSRDDSGPSTPPPSVLARKPKVNIPTPDKFDDRGILATVGDYFSNLPNPLFTPAAAADLNIEEEIKKLEQRGKDQRKQLTIADDTVAKGIGTGDILTSVPDLKDPKVAGSIAEAGGLSTSLKKVGGKKLFGSDIILGGEQIRVPSNLSQQALEEIQKDKRELGKTRKQVIDKAKEFKYPTSITEEGAGTIYDMVEAYQDFPKFAAEGGRIGAQEGGIMPRLSQLSGNVSSAEQMLQQINQRLESAESSLGSGGGDMQQPLAQVEPNAMRPPGTFMGRPLNAMSRPENTAGPAMAIPASGTLNGKPLFPEGTTFPSGGQLIATGAPQIDVPPFMRPGNFPGTDVPLSTLRGGISLGDQSPLQKAIGLADGGRIGYARGDSAEENAMQAAGVMGLPLNQNPAGITELDLRETGGFIPPVGVKEKADDIPAMLSNNEFVFTADAVRGMGDGDVNKGAQRMYDMMKRLENGGRV